MPRQSSAAGHCRQLSGVGLAALGLLWTCLGSAAALSWLRPRNCTSDCDNNHQCTSGTCFERWDNCSASEVERSRVVLVDRTQCYDNGCDNSGCDAGPPGYEEVESHWCSNLPALCVACKQETCCLRRPQLTCCPLLDCTKDLADCRVPQQRYLGLNTSRSDVYFTTLADGGTAVFPFYAAAVVPYGSSCEAVRRMGQCLCVDGSSQPGCDSSNSSTWFSLQQEEADGTKVTLPPGLSLTCLVSPAPPGSPFPPGPSPTGPYQAASGNSSASADSSSAIASTSASGTGSSSSSASASSHSSADQDAGPGRGDAHQRTPPSSLAIAGIVAGAVLGVALLGAGCWAVLTAHGRAWVKARRSESYEPVFTGQSYTPPLQPPKADGMATRLLRRLRAVWHHSLVYKPPQGTAQHRANYLQDPSWFRGTAGAEQRGAAGRGLDSRALLQVAGPALPPEVEDELFTLQDIEEDPREGDDEAEADAAPMGGQHRDLATQRFPYGGVSGYHRPPGQGVEMEMGSLGASGASKALSQQMSDSKQYQHQYSVETAGIAGSAPLYSPPAHHSVHMAGGDVIVTHTLPLSGSDWHAHEQDGAAEETRLVTPQPTGGGRALHASPTGPPHQD